MTAEIAVSPIQKLIQHQRKFFQSGQTKSVDFRLSQLQQFKQGIIDRQNEIVEAVRADLGRPPFEAYFEITTLGEVNLAIKKLKDWVKHRRVKTSIDVFPSSAWVQPEPLGVVLIIGPWNYPFQLMVSPLVGAIAAGNCAILKPSEHAPHTSKVVAKLIDSVFDPSYIAVVEGDVDTSKQLLAEKFDYIFFTGSTTVGKVIAQAAAKHLTPVTLELGGKSPCIVDADVDLETAVKRIAWGKFINAGQACVAPDYILVDRQIKQPFLDLLKQKIQTFYGDDPAKSPDYGRIINQQHFSRLSSFLANGTVVTGGQVNPENRYIAPTVLDDISWDQPVMQEEIFGPILPVLSYDSLESAIAQVNARPKPLALYIFSKDPVKQKKVLNETSSGTICINDTTIHLTISDLPFGGVGDSGIGSYHGKASFDTFSHHKSVLKRGLWLDLGWRYAPYTLKQLKKIKRFVNG